MTHILCRRPDVLIAHKAGSAEGVHIDRFRVEMADGTVLVPATRAVLSSAARDMLARGLGEPGEVFGSPIDG